MKTILDDPSAGSSATPSTAKRKRTETAAEKQQRLQNAKLNALLNKQRDMLKRDIVRKRANLDKTIQSEVQVSTA